MTKRQLSRRQFLALAGLGLGGAAGLYIGFRAGQHYLAENLENLMPATQAEPNAWLHVTPAGRVRLMMPKAEMGQGVHTALAQIIAEELYVPLAYIELDPGTSATLPPDFSGTNGSTTIASLYLPLKRAAAQAREMLKTEAARQLGADVGALTVVAGVIHRAGQPTELTYGAVIGERQIVTVAKDQPVPLKAVSDYTLIGQPAPRGDVPAKVTGAAKYGYDARVAGMVFGKVLKPPTLGATLKSVDVASAQSVPGVIEVVRDGDFVGVLAETQEAANRGVGYLNAQWNERTPPWQQSDIDRMMQRAGQVFTLREAGDPGAGLRRAAQTVEAVYSAPFAAHATLEPQAGLAHVRQVGGEWQAEVWTSTQGPGLVVTAIAQATGLKAEQIVVHPLYLGGGFGRKVVNDAAIEAARLSKATGRPVRVNWDRNEEFQHGYVRPPVLNTLRAGLTAEGRVAAWEHQQTSGFVILGFMPGPVQYLLGSDFGAVRGAIPAYAFSDHRTVVRLASDIPVKTGSWRGLGLLPNTFAVESFMDELAHAAGQDPLAFRLAHLGADSAAQRLARVLERVGALAHWGEPLPARTDGWAVGRGIAASVDVKTAVAQVAEVAVNRQSGEIKVVRVYCALDAGLIINPDITRAQIEGNIMWGTSSALLEELTVKDGRLSASNFGDYPLLTIRQAPEVISELIENPNEGPYGMGEPPIGPVAAAIGNAVFAAVGARLRQLPMRPERVVEALQG